MIAILHAAAGTLLAIILVALTGAVAIERRRRAAARARAARARAKAGLPPPLGRLTRLRARVVLVFAARRKMRPPR